MRQLEGEKFDLSIEVTFLKDKLKQARDESEARTLEADTLKLRIAKATRVCLPQTARHAPTYKHKLPFFGVHAKGM